MSFESFLNALKLGPDEKKQARAILDTPTIQAAIAEKERKELDRRLELAQRLYAAEDEDGPRMKETLKLCAEASAIRSAFLAAEENAKALKEAHMNATGRASGADMARQIEISRIKHELAEMRDRRVDVLTIYLDRAENDARLQVYALPDVTKNFATGQNTLTMHSNSSQIGRLLQASLAARRDLELLAIAAVSRDDCTKRLREICAIVAAAAEGLDTAIPDVDEYGEIAYGPRARNGAVAVQTAARAKA